MRAPLILIIGLMLGCSSPDITPETPDKATTDAPEKTPEPRESKATPRRLLLALDGISFEDFKKMQNGGYFRAFKPVAPMVATFPSISDPNWSKIMRAPLEVSFTKEHFDQNLSEGKGELTGGLMDHVLNPPTYESYFDLKQEGALQRIASMTYSETSGIYWLDVLEKRIFESRDKRVFKAFIMNTDFIAHTKGEEAIFRYLAELDKKIDQIRKHYKEKFREELEVILVSDHGNTYLKPKPVNVADVLEKDGWTLTSSLEKERDVVVVIPEILSFAPFFVKPNQEGALSASLSKAEGVHVSFFLSGPFQVDFFSNGGKSLSRASIDFKNKKLRYHIVKGKDPFDHFKFFKGHEISFSKYFQESLQTDYPYAIVRAFEGLSQNSVQKPSVLVSPILGYVFSNNTLELVTKVMGLESVHGSLHRKESLGIFVSTNQELPPVSPSSVLDFVH